MCDADLRTSIANRQITKWYVIMIGEILISHARMGNTCLLKELLIFQSW